MQASSRRLLRNTLISSTAGLMLGVPLLSTNPETLRGEEQPPQTLLVNSVPATEPSDGGTLTRLFGSRSDALYSKNVDTDLDETAELDRPTDGDGRGRFFGKLLARGEPRQQQQPQQPTHPSYPLQISRAQARYFRRNPYALKMYVLQQQQLLLQQQQAMQEDYEEEAIPDDDVFDSLEVDIGDWADTPGRNVTESTVPDNSLSKPWWETGESPVGVRQRRDIDFDEPADQIDPEPASSQLTTEAASVVPTRDVVSSEPNLAPVATNSGDIEEWALTFPEEQPNEALPPATPAEPSPPFNEAPAPVSTSTPSATAQPAGRAHVEPELAPAVTAQLDSHDGPADFIPPEPDSFSDGAFPDEVSTQVAPDLAPLPAAPPAPAAPATLAPKSSPPELAVPEQPVQQPDPFPAAGSQSLGEHPRTAAEQGGILEAFPESSHPAVAESANEQSSGDLIPPAPAPEFPDVASTTAPAVASELEVQQSPQDGPFPPTDAAAGPFTGRKLDDEPSVRIAPPISPAEVQAPPATPSISDGEPLAMPPAPLDSALINNPIDSDSILPESDQPSDIGAGEDSALAAPNPSPFIPPEPSEFGDPLGGPSADDYYIPAPTTAAATPADDMPSMPADASEYLAPNVDQWTPEPLQAPDPIVAPSTAKKLVAAPPPTRQQTDAKLERIAARKGLNGFKGFCPVALKDYRELLDARPEYSAVYNGRRFFFSTETAQVAFEVSPENYAPAALGNDVVHLMLTGESRQGSLEHAVWFRSRLYMFATAETMETFVSAPSIHARDE